MCVFRPGTRFRSLFLLPSPTLFSLSLSLSLSLVPLVETQVASKEPMIHRQAASNALDVFLRAVTVTYPTHQLSAPLTEWGKRVVQSSRPTGSYGVTYCCRAIFLTCSRRCSGRTPSFLKLPFATDTPASATAAYRYNGGGLRRGRISMGEALRPRAGGLTKIQCFHQMIGKRAQEYNRNIENQQNQQNGYENRAAPTKKLVHGGGGTLLHVVCPRASRSVTCLVLIVIQQTDDGLCETSLCPRPWGWMGIYPPIYILLWTLHEPAGPCGLVGLVVFSNFCIHTHECCRIIIFVCAPHMKSIFVYFVDRPTNADWAK